MCGDKSPRFLHARASSLGRNDIKNIHYLLEVTYFQFTLRNLYTPIRHYVTASPFSKGEGFLRLRYAGFLHALRLVEAT